MAKSNGSTRASASGNPRGLSSAPNIRGFNEVSLDDLAERLYENGGLVIDPGDAVYETARNLANNTYGRNRIEESIEGSTDYFAQATNDYVQVGNSGLEAGEAERNWGADDMVRIPYENRSLMDIIWELRRSSVSDIYTKYRR